MGKSNVRWEKMGKVWVKWEKRMGGEMVGGEREGGRGKGLSRCVKFEGLI